MAGFIAKTAFGVAALSLATGPALAQSAPVSKSSALSLRTATVSKKKSEITSPPAIAVIGLLAIVGGGIYLAVDGDNNPDSP